MTTLHTQLIVFLGLILSAVDAQSFDRYRPIGSASSGTLSSAVGGYHPVREANRVILPGLRPASAELLQQTLQQRYARNLGSSPERVSRLAVPKIFSDGPSLARARGIYAELRYVNQNPEWGLVGKRNATQNDLYTRPLNQRPPVGMQVKTLSSGPAGYAASMLNDHKARWFVVPDDHVAGIRAHWQRVGDEHYAAGRAGEASRAYRQRARVKGMGITMAGLEKEMRAGGRHLLREQSARYVSYGAAALLALAPVATDLIQEGRLTEPGFRRAIHGMALLSTAAGTNQLLKQYKSGALRGTLKGNAITGSVLLLVDSSFAVWEYGGTAAFSRPEFYERLGGGATGLALGLAVGVPVGAQVAAATSWTGPWAIAAGGAAGIISGGAAGMAGEFFGRAGTRFVLHQVSPEMLLEQDLLQVAEVRAELDDQIKELQRWSVIQ